MALTFADENFSDKKSNLALQIFFPRLSNNAAIIICSAVFFSSCPEKCEFSSRSCWQQYGGPRLDARLVQHVKISCFRDACQKKLLHFSMSYSFILSSSGGDGVVVVEGGGMGEVAAFKREQLNRSAGTVFVCL